MEPVLITLEERTVYGVGGASNDRTAAKDIPALSEKYRHAASLPKGAVLPFFVVSSDYQEDTGAFALFVGSTLKQAGLQCFRLHAGLYARLELRPKLGFFWAAAIGEAKRWFYTKWLPLSRYEGLNLEYELHSKKSIGRHPTIELLFSIRERERSEN